MNSSTVWTTLGVIVAVGIAWFLVSVLFSLLAMIFKVLIVAVVAIGVFLFLRSVLGRSTHED